MNEKTRQQMRETQGLVDALVSYIKSSLDDNKAEDKVRDGDMKGTRKTHALSSSDCICVSEGGGEFSLHLEEPLVPTVP